ncbi:hypothetical protein ACQCN2_18865 [Brevibacillus ginsengisoli]|uniref:hypothetical protein n=1 Tax=Brevibacillus ginsengisoli TaxID=363854 RepID=UPI003CF3C837
MNKMKMLMAGAVLAGSLSVSSAAFAEVDRSTEVYFGHSMHEAANTITTPAATTEVKPVDNQTATTTKDEVKPVVKSEQPYTYTLNGPTDANEK